MPQTLNSTSSLKLTLTIPVSLLVYNSVSIEFLAFVIPTPKISINFRSFQYIISDQLCASGYITRFHDISSYIFRPSLVETEDPNIRFNSSFSMMSEFRLINFNCSSKMNNFMSSIIVR